MGRLRWGYTPIPTTLMVGCSPRTPGASGDRWRDERQPRADQVGTRGRLQKGRCTSTTASG